MQKFILPSRITKAEDYSSEVVDNLLQLMLCILDGLHLADNMSVLSSVSVQWAPVFYRSKKKRAPVFQLRNSRYCLCKG